MTATIPGPRVAPEHAEGWALVDQAQAGDMEAYGLLFLRHRDDIHRFLRFRSGDAHLADDLMQEVFAKALRSLHVITYQGRDIAAWFVTIARNLLMDYYKAGYTRRVVPLAEFADSDMLAVVDDAGPREVEQHQRAEVVARALQVLTPEQRECLRLRFWDGLSVEDSARRMGVSVGACKALQYRATQTLYRRLADELEAVR